MFSLVIVSFEVAHDKAVDWHKLQTKELVELTASSIDRLWITPRNDVLLSLARSGTLHQRLAGEASFTELASKWQHVCKALEGCFFIYYGLKDGTIEYYPNDEPLPEDFAPRQRPWYQSGMKSDGEPIWSPPYKEVITGKTVVSTTAPIYRDGRKVGVIAADITFAGLKDILEEVQLPNGSSVFLVDETNRPFIGTADKYVNAGQLPQSSNSLFVASSSPMSNGWRAVVAVPSQELAESFAKLRKPIIIASAFILLSAAIFSSLLVGRTASRAYRLAEYFRETMSDSAQLRQLFKTRDEFSFLNRRFNQVIKDARRAHEEKLARERTFRFLIEQSPVGFFRTQKDGSLLYINPHCVTMLGYTQDEVWQHLSSVVQLYYDKHDRDLFLSELIEHGEVRNRKMRFLTRSGKRIWISMTARIDAQKSGPEQPDEFDIEGFIIDVTSDMEERQSLVDMAQRDPLTGAANRRAFDNAAQAVAERARTSGQTVALILFDIDRFKTINDTYGHDVGDQLLQEVVATGHKQLRESDIFARLGGDEFAILLPGSGQEAAYSLAKRLQKALKGIPLPQPLTEPPTLSIGVSVLKGNNVELAELLKITDNAMYEAKQAGRDSIACH